MASEPLAVRRCVPCEAGTPPLTEEQARGYLSGLGGWDLEEPEGKRIAKLFRLKSFREALAFINRIADIAEEEGHHPDIWFSYRRVRVELTTHAIGGLSENDFIMAAKVDRLFASVAEASA